MQLSAKIIYSVLVCYVIAYRDPIATWLVLLLGTVLILTAKQPQITRYQRLRRNGGKHTELEWRLLKFYYGNRCHYCNKRGVKLTKDHIKPVSKGGSDSIRNIVPACQQCNSSKGNKIVWQ